MIYFAVFPITDFEQSNAFGNCYTNKNMIICESLSRAKQVAVYMSQMNPGKEVHILKTQFINISDMPKVSFLCVNDKDEILPV